MIVRAGLGALSEIGEEPTDPVGDGVVPLDLAGPAAIDGVLGQLLLAGKTGSQTRGARRAASGQPPEHKERAAFRRPRHLLTWGDRV